MTSDAILVLKFLFGTIWRFFTNWYIPGTNVTPAMWGLFALLVGLVLKFVLPNLLGLDVFSHNPSSRDSSVPSSDTSYTWHSR